MLRSLHTVSSGARHAIQPHLLSIQFLFLRSFVYKTAACQYNPRHNRLGLSIFCECNSFFYIYIYIYIYIDLCIKRRQCPTLKKTQCHIPIVERSAGRSQCHFVYKTAAKPNPKKKRSVIYPSLHGVLERYNAMQCNAMQCNAMAQPNAKENAM